MNDNRRIIGFVSGSRGEYGYIKPILKAVEKHPQLDYRIIATNMHLLPEFGYTVQQFEADGFRVHHRVYMALDGYTHASMSKGLGIFLMSVSDILAQGEIDMVLLAGDRGEQLMAAIAAAHMNIPVAHVQAGELSGNIDGVMRHAITKIAHLHFASNEDAAERVRRIGEETFRVFCTGAPQLDDFLAGAVATPDQIFQSIGFDVRRPFLLVVQHPVTEELDQLDRQIEETLMAVVDSELHAIIIYPNNDAGSHVIRRHVARQRTSKIQVERSVTRPLYAGLMRTALAIVGNSSSGLLEAPSFGLPAVNIGNRQRGRLQSANVLNVPHKRGAILAAIRKCMDPQLRVSLQGMANPYGDGHATERIVEILATIPIDNRLLHKTMTY